MFLLLPNDFMSRLQGNNIIVSFFIIKDSVVWRLKHVHEPAVKCKEALLEGLRSKVLLQKCVFFLF